MKDHNEDCGVIKDTKVYCEQKARSDTSYRIRVACLANNGPFLRSETKKKMNQAKAFTSSFSTAYKSLVQSTKRIVVRTVVGTTIVVGTLEMTTELPSKGRASWFYHYMADDIGTPLLRKFLDPESAHNMAIRIAKAGLAPLHRPSAAEQRVSLQQKLIFDKSATSTDDIDTVASSRSSRIKSLIVDNPIGLAAGFDKNGEIIQSLFDMGFAFVEIGTVTPLPQPGNPSPRMFRLTADHAIINRYGFNSAGAFAVLQNVLQFHQQQHQQQQDGQHDKQELSLWKQIVYTLYLQVVSTIFTSSSSSSPSKQQGLLGINIGKNKSSTTTAQVIQDYVTCIETLGPVADYLVINVSSPNTVGLRDEWQQDMSNLQALLHACILARNQLAPPTTTTNAAPTPLQQLPPLFIKLAPDLPDETLRAIVNVCLGNSIDSNDDESSSRSHSHPLVDGIVVTNTTTTRPSDLISWQHRHEHGGLSGEPIKDISTTCIRKVYALTRGRIPIIGVGGVSSGSDAYEKLSAGASLVQVYSAMIYHGPGVISRIRQELATIMRNNGQRSITDVVGTDNNDIVYTNHFSSSANYTNTTTSSLSSSSSVPTTAMKTRGVMIETGQNAPSETLVANNNDSDSNSRQEEDEMSPSLLFPIGAIIHHHGDSDDIALEFTNGGDDDEKKRIKKLH